MQDRAVFFDYPIYSCCSRTDRIAALHREITVEEYQCNSKRTEFMSLWLGYKQKFKIGC